MQIYGSSVTVWSSTKANSSLKRFKDDVKEVQTNFECGVGIEGFNDIKEGDILETYTIEDVPREL